MREIPCRLGHGKIRLTLLRLSSPLSDKSYVDDLLNTDNVHFEQMVDRIYPAELQLNKANSSDIEAPFLDMNLSTSNDTVSTKIYDKRDDFDIVTFPFFDSEIGHIKYSKKKNNNNNNNQFSRFFCSWVYNFSLKKLLQQGISEPEFYGDLVYRIRKKWGNHFFPNNSESLLTVIKENRI